jgi:hypothetical protein
LKILPVCIVDLLGNCYQKWQQDRDCETGPAIISALHSFQSKQVNSDFLYKYKYKSLFYQTRKHIFTKYLVMRPTFWIWNSRARGKQAINSTKNLIQSLLSYKITEPSRIFGLTKVSKNMRIPHYIWKNSSFSWAANIKFHIPQRSERISHSKIPPHPPTAWNIHINIHVIHNKVNSPFVFRSTKTFLDKIHWMALWWGIL